MENIQEANSTIEEYRIKTESSLPNHDEREIELFDATTEELKIHNQRRQKLGISNR